MPNPQKIRNKPSLSYHQKRQRKATIALIVGTVVFSIVIAAAFYYYERRSMIP